MTPLVSVVVATLDRPHLLRHALASICAQSLDAGTVEAVVVNDGGAAVVGPVMAAREQGLAVRVVSLARRRGLPAARNVGIEVARGEYLAFLDDDDVFLPGHLSTALAALGDSAVDAAYTDCLVETRRIDPADPPPIPSAPAYPFDPDRLSVANFIPVHSAVIRRPPPTARFDPQLPAIEDWDMWLRLVREYGYRFVHVPQTTVVYHRIPGQASMCAATIGDAAALAGFGRITDQLWRRWPSPSAKAAHFRLYIAVMYWHALARLSTGQILEDRYFQRCVEHLAAVWHGSQAEDGLTERIIESMRGGSHVSCAV